MPCILASQLCLLLLLKPRAFVSQIVIDFVDSQPNASGELGAVAHPLVNTGDEIYMALHSPALQGRSPSAFDAWRLRHNH